MRVLLTILAILIAFPAHAQKIYRADVVSCYDGDTCRMNIELGLDVWKLNEMVRFMSLDTPEIRGDEREEGLMVRDTVRSILEGKRVTIHTNDDMTDKYGRVLVWVLTDTLHVNQWLLDSGFAVPYP